jgi:hypothetical protein
MCVREGCRREKEKIRGRERVGGGFINFFPVLALGKNLAGDGTTVNNVRVRP